MAPSMTTALILLSSHIQAVVALPESSVNIGVGQVSIVQPDSLTALIADLDFQDVSSMGLQRRTLVKKAVISEVFENFSMDDQTVDYAAATVLGLQQFSSLKVQLKSTEQEEILQADDMLDSVSASTLGLQSKAVWLESCDDFDSSLLGLQRTVVRVSSKVATVRPPAVRKVYCADRRSISSARW